jgi:1-aminocyclopropane-1-carboxylate deaminase/D-cysteine desulfhydrase-like pyridoxal-dependent ACC family enzyme
LYFQHQLSIAAVVDEDFDVVVVAAVEFAVGTVAGVVVVVAVDAVDVVACNVQIQHYHLFEW